MLVQNKAYLLLLMCLSMLCPAKMAALGQAAGPPEQAMAYLNIRLKIRAIHYGLASRIAVVAGRELMQYISGLSIPKDTMAAMVVLMAATATHREVIKYQIPLAAWAAVTVAALGTVEMQHIMVRVPAVADIMKMPTVMQRTATAAAAIKA